MQTHIIQKHSLSEALHATESWRINNISQEEDCPQVTNISITWESEIEMWIVTITMTGYEKEELIYCVDPTNSKYEGNLRDCPDEIFIKEAEKQGLVYTLEGFIEHFNHENISDQWFIRKI